MGDSSAELLILVRGLALMNRAFQSTFYLCNVFSIGLVLKQLFFSLLINTKLGGKKEEKCTESTATVFSKISEQKKEKKGKKFYLSQNNCSKRKSF